MLYLNPPYYYIDGVSLLPDHQDPLQWYFMPLYPRFSTNPGTGEIQLSLLKYRGSAGNGGFLNFDVNIGIDQPALDTVAGKLKGAAGLDDKPRLSPVPLIDGTVRFILLGKQTPPPPGAGGPPAAGGQPADASPGIRFVETILQATKPSLYGDNQAVFSAQLSQYGVTVLEEALRGAMTPIGVIYDLDYVALRPAFQVKLNVDWDRVFHYVDKMTGVDGLFVSTEIDKAVSDLREQKAIDLQADLFVADGDDPGSVVADFARAENEVKEMFTDAFFKPSLEPTKEAKDGWDRAADFGNQIGRYATTGGVSSLLTFCKKEVDLTRIDRKSLNVNMRERTAVRRSIHPQGHLSGIAAVLAGDPSKYTMSVDLDDPFFKQRKLTALSRADMSADQLTSVHVSARYGQDPSDVILDAAHPSAEMTWQGAVSGGTFQWPVSYDYEVTFANVDTSQRPMHLSTVGRPGWPKTTVDQTLEIVPREDLYTIVDVPIRAEAPVLADWPTIDVDVSYTDDANGLHQRQRYTLTGQAPLAHWPMFVLDPGKTRLHYQITYTGTDNRVFTSAATDTDDEQINVVNPFPDRVDLSIVPLFDWNTVDRAFADVSYDDPQHNVSKAQSYEFTAKKPDTAQFSVKLPPGARHLPIRYAVSILFKDGNEVDVPPSATSLPRVTLRTAMRGHRTVAVHTDGADFAAAGLTSIDVNLSFTDAQAGISAADRFTFRSANDLGQFEYDFVDGARSAYTFSAKYHYDNGLSRTIDAQTSTADDLSLPVN
ncbi:hypothetical protein ACGFK1_31660 [Mycobacterium sp. NPDC048908]|uniref:hypothetical protein n=1 Tax=Mycobacterium sp. NPDC048908 TaxID=3364292 RepID=UPI003712ED62